MWYLVTGAVGHYNDDGLTTYVTGQSFDGGMCLANRLQSWVERCVVSLALSTHVAED